MAGTHTSKVYAVSDCKIYLLTADPAGGAATYGPAIDVPGIKTVEISGDVNTAELRGDNGLLDQTTTLGTMSVSVEHAKVSLDVLNIILGGTTADSGSGSTEVATFDLLGTSTPQYFKIEAKTPSNGSDNVGGDVHFVLHKCILSSFPDLGLTEEDYRTVSFEAAVLPLLATGKQMTAVINETAAALSA